MFFRLSSIIVTVLILTAFCGLTHCAGSGPPIPSGMRIPDGIGMQLNPPELAMAGVPLIMSNSPETIGGITGPAALYRTSVSNDHFRIFFHHLNAMGGTWKVGIAVTNPKSAGGPIELFIGRNSQRLPGRNVSSVRSSPAAAGSIALRNWFLSDRGDHYLCTLKPGETRYIVQDVPVRATVTGMYDLGIKALKPKAGKADPIVTVLTCKALPADPTALRVLPPNKPGKTWHRRGTFMHSDRVGSVNCDVSGVSWIDIAGPHEGPFAYLMKNEIERAIDDTKGLNPGNYGVTYSFRIALRNPLPDPVRVRCVLNTAGGPGWSNLVVDGSYLDSGKSLPAYGSWVCKDLQIAPKSTSNFSLKFSLPGGSSGAHRLYFWPDLGSEVSAANTLEIHL